jgi:SAM-dependent methyltransferase
MVDSTRSQREKEFHDRRFASNEDPRHSLGKFYSANRDLEAFYRQAVSAECRGRSLLEYGCGLGERSGSWADMGAKVTGIDISVEAVEKARARARNEGFQAEYYAMNAENTEFDDSVFDIVVGTGIIHHLDIEASYRELSRILRTSGRIVFYEPMGTNALINLFRALTPRLRTEDEHPLKHRDIELLAQYFAVVEVRYFTFLTLLAVPFRNLPVFDKVYSMLARADQLLFRFPMMDRLAWMAVIQAAEPKWHESHMT